MSTRYVHVFRRWVHKKGGGRWDTVVGVARLEDGRPMPLDTTIGIYEVDTPTNDAAVGAVTEWLILHRPQFMAVRAVYEAHEQGARGR